MDAPTAQPAILLVTNGKCTSCSKPIAWCKTVNGANTPLDPLAHTNGNVTVADGVAKILKDAEVKAAREANTPLFLSHFATCPNAARHRNRKTGAKK